LLRSDTEKALFDEIVQCVWGVTTPLHYSDDDNTVAANLEYLQSLLSNLASETNALIGTERNHPPDTEGYRFGSRPQDVYSTEPVYRSDTDKRGDKNKSSSADDGGYHEMNIPSKALWEFTVECELLAQQTAVMLMAGAIFGVILAFLVGKSAVESSAFPYKILTLPSYLAEYSRV
jgi:hypothetical protein